MADALAYFGDPKTEEVERFIRYFDKFFDCLNVKSFGKQAVNMTQSHITLLMILD